MTLRVVGDDENSAPQWWVEGCQQSRAHVEVAAGGTVAVPVLGDWVDPRATRSVLLSAALESGTAQAASTPEGRVVFQHADTGEGGDATAPVTLTVADTRGAVTTKTPVRARRSAAAPAVVRGRRHRGIAPHDRRRAARHRHGRPAHPHRGAGPR